MLRSLVGSEMCIRDRVYGIEVSTDLGWILEMLETVQVPEFTPDRNLRVPDTDEAAKKEQDLATADPANRHELHQVMSSLGDCSERRLVSPHCFEKDDDSNFHIDWVTAASNLRARCYGIPTADRNQTKVIAGKIIPAIATTTAMVAGLVCLELCKVVLNKPLEQYKNGYVDLATNVFHFWEPVACKANTVGELEFSMWDRIVVDDGRDLTLRELIVKLEQAVSAAEVEIDMIGACDPSGKSKLLYNTVMPKSKKTERLDQKVSELAAQLLGGPIPGNELTLAIDGEDEDGEPVDLPPVRYCW
eukprot:TRINITY_DN16563_c0_g2_i4.p1 TRINITY_DN16563_c0_g2~~TRINITY_DN16563_c0_g2_i4.p1  ORF type:complete len:303 (-),score=86.20 TRINITY_DN16563_c0_g2_i4:336-1244(-)